MNHSNVKIKKQNGELRKSSPPGGDSATLIIAFCILLFSVAALCGTAFGETIEIPADRLRDQIRGGLLGQMLGNLNGLPHEMKYIDEPGNVTTYTPALPEGARTDDDTDFEWVYIKVMQDENCLLLPPARIAQLWKQRINTRIWCSNQYARQLMDLGLEPPLTGRTLLNPWADFNISGQFICETFGLIAPAMPQSAARIGLNYTTVTIDGEPAQTTQLFTTIIAQAFLTSDIDELLDAGQAAVDPTSVVYQIVRDVRGWYEQHPDNWRQTRRLLKDKYTKHGGAMRDKNGYELNAGATIAALLYGQGDFVQTLITAFNFGWDADNSAASAGTIVGVTKGYRWMLAQGWPIVDRYRNTTRQDMPMDETITSFADRLIDLAERAISAQGGQRIANDGQIVYRVQRQRPACVQPLRNPDAQSASFEAELRDEINLILQHATSNKSLACAAYCAICLDMADFMQTKYPQQWSNALHVLATDYPNVVQAIFYHAPTPQGEVLRKKALTAGLQKPATRQDLW